MFTPLASSRGQIKYLMLSDPTFCPCYMYHSRLWGSHRRSQYTRHAMLSRLRLGYIRIYRFMGKHDQAETTLG